MSSTVGFIYDLSKWSHTPIYYTTTYACLCRFQCHRAFSHDVKSAILGSFWATYVNRKWGLLFILEYINVTKFVFVSLFLIIKTFCPNIWAKLPLKNEKSPLLVDVCPSKTTLLKFTIGVPKQLTGGRIGVRSQSRGSWTFPNVKTLIFVCSNKVA